MQSSKYEGKTLEEALNSAYKSLNLTEENIVYYKEEIKGGLFKGSSIKVTVYQLTEILEYIKEVLTNILSGMGIEVNFETSIRNKQITIKMYSNNNAILIGKNGQTLSALQIILKQSVFKETGSFVLINLDVENYKDKQISNLERLAKNTAREVRETKVPATLMDMNAYERRIVHSILTDYKGVLTTSEGEEPQRHVVIKPKED